MQVSDQYKVLQRDHAMNEKLSVYERFSDQFVIFKLPDENLFFEKTNFVRFGKFGKKKKKKSFSILKKYFLSYAAK